MDGGYRKSLYICRDLQIQTNVFLFNRAEDETI